MIEELDRDKLAYQLMTTKTKTPKPKSLLFNPMSRATFF